MQTLIKWNATVKKKMKVKHLGIFLREAEAEWLQGYAGMIMTCNK